MPRVIGCDIGAIRGVPLVIECVVWLLNQPSVLPLSASWLFKFQREHEDNCRKYLDEVSGNNNSVHCAWYMDLRNTVHLKNM